MHSLALLSTALFTLSTGLPSTTSQTTPSTTSGDGVGNFVAKGLGIDTATTPSPTSINSSVSSHLSTLHGSSTKSSHFYANSTTSSSHPSITKGAYDNLNLTYAPITAVGNASLWSCYSQWDSWSILSDRWWTSVNTPTTTNTYTVTPMSTWYSTYKLCDGFPRAVVTGTAIYTTVVDTLTNYRLDPNGVTTLTSYSKYTRPETIHASGILLSETTYDAITDTYPVPADNIGFGTKTQFIAATPTCSIDAEDCASLWYTYQTQRYLLPATATEGFGLMRRPHCDRGSSNFFTAPCTILVPSVQVI